MGSIMKMGDRGGSSKWPPSQISEGDTPVASTNFAFGDTFYYSGVYPDFAPINSSSLTIKKAGTYRFKTKAYFWLIEGSGSSLIGATVCLYKNNSIVAASSRNLFGFYTTYSYDLECSAGDVIKLGYKKYSTNTATTGFAIGGLLCCVSGDNGF